MLKTIIFTILLLIAITARANMVTITADSTNILKQYSTDEGCKKTLKQLKINNSCDEVRKIINAFDRNPILVATFLHESNFNRNARNVNKNGSVDSGVFQLNSTYWTVNGDINHSITQAQKCYKDMGYKCWASYNNGKYKERWNDAILLIKNI